jgi:hypothetical protein
MKPKFVIVSDEREIKFFQVRTEQHDENKRTTLDLLKDFSNIEGNQKISEVYSDKMGGFKDSTKHGGGTSEPKIDIEREKKHIKYIAGQMNELDTPEGAEIYLSAPQTILKRLEEEISSELRGKIKTILPKNLVNLPVDKILQEFDLK